MSREKTAITVVFLILTAACSSSATGIATPVLADEAWKAVENYEYAYDTRDLSLLCETLDPEFLHHLLEEDWDDYNGDGTIDSNWDYDLEISLAQSLFSTCDSIDLTLTGLWYYPWPSDPSGESIAYPRHYTMELQINPDSIITETGQYTIVCRPDSTDDWRITHLIDSGISWI
ncbi:MAG: hypothetical protein K8S62_07030 [Candidatus Sabulitectum sp.]|nr:hypothetical protein [Candidatus Sabulitectum sp.]